MMIETSHVKYMRLGFVSIVFILLYCPLNEANVYSCFGYHRCLRSQDVETSKAILSPGVLHCSSLCGDGCIAVIFEDRISSSTCALVYGGLADVPKSSAASCGSNGATGQVWLKGQSYSGPEQMVCRLI